MPLRLALVGAGRMGATHARALAERVDEVELAAVVEPSDAAVAALPALPCRYRTTAELLAAGGVDGAIVAVPTRFHAEVVPPLLEAGVPVLCEKPCGLTSDEARGLASLAERTGTPLLIGYWRRFVPALRDLQARLAAGALGHVSLVHCAQWDEHPPPASFRDPASSGGIAVDMGVHEFDQLRWLTGAEIVAVRGVSSQADVAGDPDSAAFVLELASGAIALVTLLRRHPPGDLCRLELVAAEGVERLDFLAPGDGEGAFLAALAEQARDFARTVRGERSAGATAADAVAALEAAERARGELTSSRPAPR